MDDIAEWQLHLSDNEDMCDICRKILYDDYVKYGYGESGRVCIPCYSSLVDNPMKEDW